MRGSNIVAVMPFDGVECIFLRGMRYECILSAISKNCLLIARTERTLYEMNRRALKVEAPRYISQINFSKLRHKLDSFFDGSRLPNEFSVGTLNEAAEVAKFDENSSPWDNSNTFMPWIRRMNTDLTHGFGRWRDQELVREHSSTGSAYVFPTPSNVIASLTKMFAVMDNIDSMLMRSVFVFVCIVFLHPFTDGNGRLARTVMNCMLRRYFAQPYVPIKEITEHVWGGYVIRMRLAGVFNEWDDIIKFFCHVFTSVAGLDPT